MVLFIASGRIPQKIAGNIVLPPSIRFSFPRYDHAPPIVPLDVRFYPPRPVLPPIHSDFGSVIRQSLQQRKTQILVKETARVVAKEALAQSVGDKNGDSAEALVRMTLFLLEEADTRSWLTLPRAIALVRIPLPAARHHLQLQTGGSLSGKKTVMLPELNFHPGQRVFHSLRF